MSELFFQRMRDYDDSGAAPNAPMCWRYLNDRRDVCIQARGHDDGAHETNTPQPAFQGRTEETTGDAVFDELWADHQCHEDVAQCSGCGRLWPCDTRQLLTHAATLTTQLREMEEALALAKDAWANCLAEIIGGPKEARVDDIELTMQIRAEQALKEDSMEATTNEGPGA